MNDKPDATTAEVLAASGLKSATATCSTNAADAAVAGVTALTCTINGGPSKVAGLTVKQSRAADGTWTCSNTIAAGDKAAIVGSSCSGS
jgi:type IV pilus assembly protein PilA